MSFADANLCLSFSKSSITNSYYHAPRHRSVSLLYIQDVLSRALGIDFGRFLRVNMDEGRFKNSDHLVILLVV